jgi:hypothetical protein
MNLKQLWFAQPSIIESVTTGVIATRPHAFLQPIKRIHPKRELLTPTTQQFISAGPRPPHKRKPEAKTFLMRRKKVYSQ